MSFRQYGGINYAARNNIVKNNYSNANNLSVMTKVGQPSSYINFESDISGNTIYGPYDFIGDVSITGNLSVSGNSTLSGNVGIGTTSSSSYALDVSGNLRVSQDALINGLTVGKGSGNLSANTAVGYQALNLNTTGDNNTAIGNSALFTNSTGSGNMAVGTESLFFNETGSDNMGIGYGSLYSNTIGSNNTAVGAISLIGNITGSNNTANGHNALLNNTSGSTNTAVGSNAGKNNTTTSNNTYIGYQADCSGNIFNSTAIGYNSKITASNQIMMGTSSETVYIPGKLTVVFDASINGLTLGKGGGSVTANTAVGYNSLQANTTGNNNTAVGYESMRNNINSLQNTSLGTNALFSQKYSGKSNGAGGWLNNLGDNTAIGFSALYWNNGSGQDSSGNLSGAWNTAVGLNALKFNTTGYYNTAVGLQAGVYFNSSLPNGGGPEKANKCTFLGSESRCSDTLNELSQSTAIGYNSVIDASNQIMMGTSSETVKIPGGLQYSSFLINVTNTSLISPLKQIYFVNSVSGMNITLPIISGISGIIVTFRRVSNNTYPVTLTAGTGDLIIPYDGYAFSAQTLTMSTTLMTYTLISRGDISPDVWYVISYG